ncbi:MAG: DUF1292 domain-containing protein [Ruminiclostridium sp.]|nr:DUF1292 domain-containing protein [Ruminiclostridium sp.]
MTENIPEENIYLLEDNDGNEVPFEFVDLMEYEGEEYLFLLPIEDDNGEVLILHIDSVDGDEEAYSGVESEELLTILFNMFREKYEGVYDFADE